jgi:hypothetical protein
VGYLADQKNIAQWRSGSRTADEKKQHEKKIQSNGRIERVLVEKKTRLENQANLRAHDAGFDFWFPDHISGFQGLNADLALLRSAVLADPRYAIAGAAVLALQPDSLSHVLDSRRRDKAGSGSGNFIGAAILRFYAGNVREDFYGHGKMQPLFMALFRSCYNGSRASGRR